MSTPNAPNQLSFLPEDYLDRKARRRANVLCGALSVVVLGAIGTVFATSERSMKDVETQFAEVDQRYAQASQQIEQVNQMRAQQARIVQQAELASSLVERVPRSNLLAEFTNALPPGVSLLDLSMTSTVKLDAASAAPKTAFEAAKAAREAATAAKKAEVPQAKVYDVGLKVTGVADKDEQVAAFITRLNDSKLINHDANLVFTESFKQDERPMRKFQVDMTLNPDAEVTEETVANATAENGNGAAAATADNADAVKH